ncbi:MAG: type II secretion system F family protein [Verrucomicrobiales bacterium]|jgi:type IV pilus assembly protein PilC|nr:type II secretion system F family protein [Verrucomicrobiales bacterium]
MSWPSRNLELFLRQLATLSDAGVPMAQGLRALAPQLPVPFNRLAAAVSDDLAAGVTLSAAVARHRRRFDPATLTFIAVGERTGRLAALLTQAADLVAQRRDTLRKLSAKLAYPLLLLHAAVLIPAGKTLFLQGAAAAAGEIAPPLLLLYAAILGGWQLLRARRISAPLDTLMMRLPLLGFLLQARAAGNFSRCLGAFLLAGVNVRAALAECAPATGSPSAAADLARARDRIADGDTLSEALTVCRFLPPVSRGLIATGEQSGTLPLTLAQNAQLLDEEAQRKTALLAAGLGGLIFTLVAAYIAWLVINTFAGYYGQLGEI